MLSLSIIIPVFNVEKYIRQCLDSILESSFQDWECILVDDGSPDNAGKICDNYAKKDKRFKSVHKENGGVSSARNLGIRIAKGEWITFIDADDFVGVDYLKELCSLSFSIEGLDFIHGGCTNYEDGKISSINQSYTYYEGMDKGHLLSQFRGLVFSKLFRLQTIRDAQLVFDEKMKIAEDMAFTIDYLLYVSKYAFVPEKGYYYRRDNSSSSTHIIKNQNYEIARHSFEHLYNSYMIYIQQNNISEQVAKKRYEQLANHLLAMLASLYSDKSISQGCRIGKLKQWIGSDYSWLLRYIQQDSPNYTLARILLREHFFLFDCLQRTRLAYSRVKALIRNRRDNTY